MADGVFGVEVVTPEQSLFAGGATLGGAGHLGGRAHGARRPHAARGRRGALRGQVEQPTGTLVRLAVHGGFLQVDTSPGAAEGLAEGDGPLPGLSTRVTVLAGVAELAAEIDVPRAERAKEAAAQRVHELGGGRGGVPTRREEDVELSEAEARWRRAELRLAVAPGPPRQSSGGQ